MDARDSLYITRWTDEKDCLRGKRREKSSGKGKKKRKERKKRKITRERSSKSIIFFRSWMAAGSGREGRREGGEGEGCS